MPKHILQNVYLSSSLNVLNEKVILKNPDKIDKVAFSFERKSEEGKYELKGSVKTEAVGGAVEERMNMRLYS